MGIAAVIKNTTFVAEKLDTHLHLNIQLHFYTIL